MSCASDSIEVDPTGPQDPLRWFSQMIEHCCDFVETAKAQKRPILLGEFGAYDRGGADIDSRVRYTSQVARQAEKLGWGWAYWQFDSDFVVYDMGKDEWVRPIWRALIPE